jgi:hypothetical protein
VAENQEIVKQEPQKIQTISQDISSYASYLDTAKFNQIWRVANVFAASKAVPEHYQNKPNDCFIAFAIAERLRQDPFMFMQKTFVVKGKMGYEAQEIIALANTRGVFEGPIDWKFSGEGKTRSCTAFAVMKSDGKPRSSTVTWDMVEKEGWNKNPKWLTMTDHMFKYRSASFLIGEVCPEVKMGMYTKEELEDIESGPEYKPTEKVSSLDEKLKRKKITSEVQNFAQPEIDKENELEDLKHEQELAEIDQFTKPVPSEAQNPSQYAPETKNSPASDIPASQRYECGKCGMYFEKPAGLNKNMCPKLHVPITDRWNPDKK